MLYFIIYYYWHYHVSYDIYVFLEVDDMLLLLFQSRAHVPFRQP